MQNPDPRPRRARRAGPLKGRAVIPGDKSISQRAIILGGLAAGETRISGLLESGDVHSTAGAVRALGATVTRDGPGNWRVTGATWSSPAQPLDFGNSGTGSRLVMGAVAGQGISATFVGDASLMSRPMARVLDPLAAFGATYEGQGAKALMPVTSRLGFRTELAFSRYSDWAGTMPEIELIERRELPPLGHFSLVRFRKTALAANDSINGAVRAPVNEVVQ